LPVGVFSNQAIVTDYLAHNRAIFLFYKALVTFLVGPPAGKGDVFMFTIGYYDLIDELSPVVGINPEHGKRDERACSLEGGQHRLLAPVQEWQAFRPASCHVRECQRVQVTTLDVGATMGH
jgi:hypothetical protein